MRNIRPWIAILFYAALSGCAGNGSESDTEVWFWVLAIVGVVGTVLFIRWLAYLFEGGIYPE